MLTGLGNAMLISHDFGDELKPLRMATETPARGVVQSRLQKGKWFICNVENPSFDACASFGLACLGITHYHGSGAHAGYIIHHKEQFHDLLTTL